MSVGKYKIALEEVLSIESNSGPQGMRTALNAIFSR